jgi:hypothetical protein
MSLFIPFGFYKQPFVAGGGLDPDAEAFLTAAGITDPTIESAINQLVLDLKSAGIWTKMKAIYPFVGGTATTHKYNLKDPQNTNAAYRLTYSGTVTHSANGIVGNGTDAFYNTYLTASTMGQNDVFMGVYIRTNVSADRTDIGLLNTTPGVATGLQINSRSTSNTVNSRCNNSTATLSTTANSDSIGFHSVSRLASASYVMSKNKVHSTKTVTSVSASTRIIFGLCINLNGVAGLFSTRQQSLAAIGDGLTTAEIDDFVDANEAFQTTLGRFV